MALTKLQISFTQYGTQRTGREFTVTEPIPFLQPRSLSMEFYDAEDKNWIEPIRFPVLRNFAVECKGWHSDRTHLVESLHTAISESKCRIETLQLHFTNTAFPASWEP